MSPQGNTDSTAKINDKFRVLSEDDNLKSILDYLSKSRASVSKEKVCVVSMIGKSTCEANSCKAALVDHALKRNIFRGTFCENKSVFDEIGCQIEGYYESRNNVIFLHLNSSFDAAILVQILKDLEKEVVEKGFLQVWPQVQMNVAKAILMLFHISHIVVIVQPTPYFDLNYISFFRTLDSARLKLQPIISDMLDSMSLPSDWQQAGRPCSPRVLFIFESYDKHGMINKYNLHDCERALEEQIFRLLRKSRVITNNSGNSLFAISNHNDFVYISIKDPTIRNPTEYLLDRLIKYCNINDETQDDDNHDDGSHSFYSFLWAHIGIAFSKGFDDNIGRQIAPPIFELPTLKEFFEVIGKLKKVFFSTKENSDLKSVFKNLRSSLDIDTRFSEARCVKMLPIALSLYQDNLPSHYTRDAHERKLAQALHHFSLHARGPALYDYSQKLKNDCETYWRNGHQMCEVLSLTGNHCVEPIHRLKQDDNDMSDEESSIEASQLPSLYHNSGIKLISSCDCSRKQGTREDPFTLKAANYDFYIMMRNKCSHCSHLERVEFPVFEANNEYMNTRIKTPSGVGSQTSGSKSQLYQDSMSQEEFRFESQPEATSSTNMSPHLNTGTDSIKDIKEQCLTEDAYQELNLEDEKLDDKLVPKSMEDELNESEGQAEGSMEIDVDRSQVQMTITDNESTFRAIEHESSGTEYLSGMLHSLSPPGLLPKFSSWSLVCLGPSSIYSHNIGMQDPGWISGSNFLMPWDVTVKLEHAGQSPQLWEGKRPPGIKNKKTFKDGTQFTVKIFLGIEYECHRGHRFIMSGPDSVLRTSMGAVRETANRMASNDMPLYFSCPHRSGKQQCNLLAQMMRIHLVTPKAPIHVTLNPRIQPAPLPCPIFYPGNSEPIKLSQSTYWILRLPFIYEGDDGPYFPPKHLSCIESSRLLRGCFGVADFVAKHK